MTGCVVGHFSVVFDGDAVALPSGVAEINAEIMVLAGCLEKDEALTMDTRDGKEFESTRNYCS